MYGTLQLNNVDENQDWSVRRINEPRFHGPELFRSVKGRYQLGFTLFARLYLAEKSTSLRLISKVKKERLVIELIQFSCYVVDQNAEPLLIHFALILIFRYQNGKLSYEQCQISDTFRVWFRFLSNSDVCAGNFEFLTASL